MFRFCRVQIWLWRVSLRSTVPSRDASLERQRTRCTSGCEGTLAGSLSGAPMKKFLLIVSLVCGSLAHAVEFTAIVAVGGATTDSIVK